MDQHKLRSHVFDKTGIKIDVDDPIFALVALNEAVLAETVQRQLAQLDAATQALAAQARAAGGLSPLIDTPAPAPAATPTPASTAWFTPREWRLLGAAAIVAISCALLVLGGAALLYQPAPASPATQVNNTSS
ncbi:hypothetical protein [Janthinobacterium sp. S3T4]|uniref:hypothetical protein n=1 Tax=unclassified Janthinobacterium TaxID=2610881 RepID=UPI001615C7A4|nr:hypothetical protein [Janthinobacterium sp. S3T4]MBB5612405.1 hypothetical protein [Janthinobacterium sp. S3M3]